MQNDKEDENFSNLMQEDNDNSYSNIYGVSREDHSPAFDKSGKFSNQKVNQDDTHLHMHYNLENFSPHNKSRKEVLTGIKINEPTNKIDSSMQSLNNVF